MVNESINNYEALISDLIFFINVKMDKYEALKEEAIENDNNIEDNCSYALYVGHLHMLVVLRDFLKQNNYIGN